MTKAKYRNTKLNDLKFSSLKERELTYSLNLLSMNIIQIGFGDLKTYSMTTTLSTNLLSLTRAVESYLVRLSNRLSCPLFVMYRGNDIE